MRTDAPKKSRKKNYIRTDAPTKPRIAIVNVEKKSNKRKEK